MASRTPGGVGPAGASSRKPVRDNAQLVARAADLAGLVQRPALTPAQARDLLRVKDRRGR